MRSWARSYVKWNLAANQNYGPNTGGCNTCTPLVYVNTSTLALSYGIEFYTLGHFSKFVLPGAYRVFSGNASGMVSAAFLNPDGSKALVAFNDTTGSQTFQVQWGSQLFSYTLASYAGATFTWTGTKAVDIPSIPRTKSKRRVSIPFPAWRPSRRPTYGAAMTLATPEPAPTRCIRMSIRHRLHQRQRTDRVRGHRRHPGVQAR